MPALGSQKKPSGSRNIKEALEQAASKMAPITQGHKAAAPPLSSLREIDDDDEDSEASSPSALNSSAQRMMLKRFDRMLQKALQATSKQITDKLTLEIRELGQRTADLEVRMDSAELSMEAHAKELESSRDDQLQLQSKLEDLENRSRRANLRFRGIPEHVTDLQATITALIQELVPSIPVDRLEMDRVHRALIRKTPDGPPRDIVAKFLYYRTKEAILTAARSHSSLSFQGHDYQIFADLAPTTIIKRREMKPLLQHLQNHQIPYRWGFPFRLLFQFNSRQYQASTPSELHRILLNLSLLPGRPVTPPSSSTKRRHPPTPDLQQSPFQSPGASGKKRSSVQPSMECDTAD